MPPQEGWRPERLSFIIEAITAATIIINTNEMIIVPNILLPPETYFTAFGRRNKAHPKQAITTTAKMNPKMLPLPANIEPSW